MSKSVSQSVGQLVVISRELKHATFLSHGRQPEVNISSARTVVSQIFKLMVSTSEKTLNNINVVV